MLPGLIDSHAHAGHGMLRTMGAGDPNAWMDACAVIYTSASDEQFWHAESAMTSLERLKAGVTTGVSLFGGGDSIMRVDDPKYAKAHCDAVARAGTRSVVVGRAFAARGTHALSGLGHRAADGARHRCSDHAGGLQQDHR
ncbi:amidohydrolase family protein [Polaromonas sp. P2-4]|nr:amidohydrolase family protein [Polaromonas sp. P2-4]